MALQHQTKPDIVATVFAGADVEATERARGYFTGYPPSSPSIALMRDGKLLWMLERRNIAYTTVMSELKTLEQKGYLKATQQDRAYLYRPTRPKNHVIRDMVREFVERVFNGSARPLVVHLLEDDRLSESDLREISRMMGKKK